MSKVSKTFLADLIEFECLTTMGEGANLATFRLLD